MPIPVNFKGLAVIEYPDDWTEDRIREDARVNSDAITRKIQAALNEQAVAETAKAPENQPRGLLEHLGDAAMGTMQSAQVTAAQPPKMMGRTLEVLPPEAFAQDPMGGMYIPPEQQRVFDDIHRQRVAESPEQVKQRIASNPLIQMGQAIEADAKQRFETLPGADQRFWSGQVPQGLGTTVAGVGAALVGGPIGAFQAIFTPEANDAWDEEIQRQTESGETYNPDKALLKAYGYGAFAAAVEGGLGVGRLTRQLKKTFGGTAKEAVQKAASAGVLGSFLAKTVKESAAGFTEEAVQRLGESLIVHGKPDLEGAVKEGLVGAIVQGGLSAPANLVESRGGVSRRLPQTSAAVEGMQRSAGRAGVIQEPEPLTAEDVADIEGVDEAVAAANAPKETPKIPPLPVAKPGESKGVPEPEGAASIIEQLRLTADPQSSKAATLITNGTDMPEVDTEGLMEVKTKHGIVIFNPDKIGPDEIADAAAGDVFDGRILGMADSGEKPIQSAVAVTTSTPNARNVVTELVDPTPEAIKAASEAQQAAVPGGTTEVKPAAQIVAERREDRGKPVSEAAQPATPQAEQPGVVEPGPVGVVAPPVAAPTPNESQDQPRVEEGGVGIKVRSSSPPIDASGEPSIAEPKREPPGTPTERQAEPGLPGAPEGQVGGVRAPEAAPKKGVRGKRSKPGDAGGVAATRISEAPGGSKKEGGESNETKEEEGNSKGLLKPGDRVQWTDDDGKTVRTGVVRERTAIGVSVNDDDSGRNYLLASERLKRVEAPSKEPDAPAKSAIQAPKKRRQPTDRPPDLLDDIEGHVGAIDPTLIQEADPNWRPTGAARKLFRRGGVPADSAISALAAGTGSIQADLSIDQFGEAINSAARGRPAARKATATEKREATEAGKQRTEFEKKVIQGDRAKGAEASVPVDLENIFTGDTFEVEGVKFLVTEVEFDEDGRALSVTVKDGSTFGVQVVDGSEVIHVDPGSHKSKTKGEDDFKAPDPEAKKPEGFFEKPESIEEQKAREAKEKAAREAKAEKTKIAELAAKPLIGNAGDLGQGDLLKAPEDLFAPPTPGTKKKTVKEKLDVAIEKTGAEVKRLKKQGGKTKGSGAPQWLTPQLLNWLLRAIRIFYLRGLALKDAIRSAVAQGKTQGVKGYNEAEAIAYLDSTVTEDTTKKGAARVQLTPDEEPIEAKPRGTQAGKATPRRPNETVESLPIGDTGEPIQRGGRRGQSKAELGSMSYIRQKERERQLFAEEFITRKGSLDASLDHIGEVRDPAFQAVVAGEILARAAESLQDPKAIGALDSIDATRIVRRATTIVQEIKTDSAQTLQAQNQVNERLGPFRGVLSYLELIRSHQERVLSKKYPSVISDNIRAWMKESARRAIEAVARQMKNPGTVVTRMLRKAGIEADISWSALFQADWDTQKAAQIGLFKAIRTQPDLAKLSKAEAIELTNLLMTAWTKEHDAIFKSEFNRAVAPGGAVKPHAMKQLVRSLPRIVRWLNLGLLDDEHFRQSVAPEYGIGTLDDAQVIRLSELAQEAQKTPEGMRRNKVYQRMVDVITSSQGINTTDLLKDYWFANVLSGLRTWIDVGVGSWISGFTMTARAAADLTIHGSPKMAARTACNFVRATFEGIANAADIIATGDVSRLPDTQKRLWSQLSGKSHGDSLEAAKKFGSGWRKGLGQMAYVRRIMTGLDQAGAAAARDAMVLYTAISRGDEEAIQVALKRFNRAETKRAEQQARDELGAKAKWVDIKARQREILEVGLSEEIKEGANNLGRVAALNADPVGVGGLLYRAIAHFPWIIRAPLGLSFARAAINMAQNASDWMPGFGLANWGRAAFTASDYYQGLPDRHPLRVFKLDVPPERRRLIMAAQIGGLVITAAAVGLFLGDDDDDRMVDINGSWKGVQPQKKGQLLTQGEKPLSIRIGSKWYSYKNTPFASALAFVGNLRDKQRFQDEQFNAESASERLLNAWLRGSLYILDVSALSQFAEVIGQAAVSTKDELDSANRKIASTIGNTVSGFVPGASLLREIDTMSDPSVYRATSGMEAWIRNIPFARRAIGVGPAVDALGDEIEAPRTPWGRWVSGKNDDPEWELLARLAMRGTFVPVPSKTATIVGSDGARRQMSPSEYYRYQVAAGKLWREAIRDDASFLEDADHGLAAGWFKKRTEDIHKKAREEVDAEQ